MHNFFNQSAPEPGPFWRVHHSHRQSMRRIAGLLAVLAVFQFIAWIIPATPGSRGIASYMPLHSLMETISIVIAMMVFAVGWNSHAGKTPGNLVLLACLFFAVGLLDFSHAASYSGMPDFFSPNDSDKHLNFWIVARLLAASALLIVTLRPWEREISLASKYSMFVTLVVATGLLNWVVIDSQDMLPDLFIPGQGLTPLKKSLEYLCITINLVTLPLLWVKMRSPQSFNAPVLGGFNRSSQHRVTRQILDSCLVLPLESSNPTFCVACC